ncbi:MAG: putative competence protein [Candidatus Kaiserbacteria bacterium]|nr:putative competence protein [Candidatus Kaiserbacteria bacterium]
MYILRALKTGFEAVLDTVIPLRPRSARTKALRLEKIPLTPTSHELLGERITTLMDYQQPAVRDLIQSLKYDGAGYAAHLCAAVLSEYLSEEIASARMFSQKRIVIVPIPLHDARARERGFNQIELVLTSLPEAYRDGESTLIPRVLQRVRHTTPQTHLARAERLRNVAGAFAVSNPAIIQNTHVYLIDDVTTTGSTLVHAGMALKRAGAEISLIALARA